MKKVTVCVLLYGDYEDLARRTLDSIINNFDHEKYELRVGCNEVCVGTLAYVSGLVHTGEIDSLYISHENINKCRMMRRMFKDIKTDYIWWFDDDSHVLEPDTFDKWIEEMDKQQHEFVPSVMIGKVFFFGDSSAFDYGLDISAWIKQQRWYRNRPVPCGVTSYEHDFNTGPENQDTRYFFITGGTWIIKTEVIEMLNWPTQTLIKRNDDVILCCALRQNGYRFSNYDYGVAINDDENYGRRGDGEDEDTMKQQIGG